MSEKDGQQPNAGSKSLASMVEEIIDLQEMMGNVLEENREKLENGQRHQNDQLGKNIQIERRVSNFINNDTKSISSIAKTVNVDDKYDVISVKSSTNDSDANQIDGKSATALSAVTKYRKSPSIKEIDTKSLLSKRSVKSSPSGSLVDEDRKSIDKKVQSEIDPEIPTNKAAIVETIDDSETDKNNPISEEDKTNLDSANIENIDSLKSGEDKLAEAIKKATVGKPPKMTDQIEEPYPEVKKRDSLLSSSMNIINKVVKRKSKKKDTSPRKSTKPRVASGSLRRRTPKVLANTDKKPSPRFGIQRPLSAANDLALLRRKMAEMIKENRLLRQIQHRQELCMRRMEESKAEAPAQLIRCQEEIRVLKEHLRIQRLKNLEFDRLLRDRGMQMEQLRDRLRRAQQTVDDQGLRMPRRSKEEKIMQKMLIEKEKTIKKLLNEVELLKSKRFNDEILRNIAQIEVENENAIDTTNAKRKNSHKTREKSRKGNPTVERTENVEDSPEKEMKIQRKQWKKERALDKADQESLCSQKKDDQQHSMQQSNKHSMTLSYSNQNIAQHQPRTISLQHQYHHASGNQITSSMLQNPHRSTSIAANLSGRNFANHSTINSAASSHLTFKK